jgi:hypothetical protein
MKIIKAKWFTEMGTPMRLLSTGGMESYSETYSDWNPIDVGETWQYVSLSEAISKGNITLCTEKEEDPIIVEFPGVSYGAYRLTVDGENSKIEWRENEDHSFKQDMVCAGSALAALYAHLIKVE